MALYACVRSAIAGVPNAQSANVQCLYGLIGSLQHLPSTAQARCYSVQPQQQCNSTGMNLADMPPHIILIRHGEVGTLMGQQLGLDV